MSDIQNPHDRFVKEMLARPEAARSIVREYLPREVVESLDLATLVQVTNSWVDTDLQEHFADCLFRCRWARRLRGLKSTLQPYLLLLAEHKSQADKLVGLQILRYKVQCWTDHLKRRALPLPMIFPLVVYHGKFRWPHTTRFGRLFGDLPGHLRQFVPEFNYHLLDLSPQSETPIEGEPLTRVSLDLLRTAHEPNIETLKAALPKILAQLPLEQATQLKFMEPIFQYLSSAHALPVGDVGEALRQAFPEQEKIMKSFVEELREQGRAEGIEKGRSAMALQLLRRKFGDKAIGKSLAGRIEKLSLARLEQLGNDLLDLESPADLQRWLANP